MCLVVCSCQLLPSIERYPGRDAPKNTDAKGEEIERRMLVRTVRQDQKGVHFASSILRPFARLRP